MDLKSLNLGKGKWSWRTAEVPSEKNCRLVIMARTRSARTRRAAATHAAAHGTRNAATAQGARLVPRCLEI